MQRIVILGNSGSGKSTLARTLGQRLAVPVVHLDALFWQPGWVEPHNEDFRARVRDAVSQDAWICEGNYARRTFDLRLPHADLVIWLDTNRLTCLTRVIVRNLVNRPRADLPPGCPEKLDKAFLTFLDYVWKFDRVSRPSLEAARLLVAPQVPVVHVRGTRQIAAFVASLAIFERTNQIVAQPHD